ncbi:helix-turn-helix domain-containing protein [Serratia fonticola]|jgi:transcriptional regulator with XRE-family HTH domain|uniref:helix-turn-helix domain-containing protein n=1 Tax=Serratia fonticola TaxID=47917 RepID=UPI001AE1F530|nr:helix-turn-helix transcriptional regulator [Serratia fonticola]
MKTLCERLQMAMQKTGITSQSELSRLSGVNQSIISKILTGKNETSKFSGKIAAALGISADWLINGSGSMEGDDAPLQMVDVSRLVSVWDESGKTNDVISWHERMPDYYRAYIMRKNTGISKVPLGAITLVDPTIAPGNDDLVVTNIRGEISTYRFLEGGASHGFLAVDDDRVPLFEVTDPSCVIGVVEQILIRKLR